MRWLFLTVLTLNLAYIAWEITNKSIDPYANVQPLKNVPSIVLLGELKQATPPVEVVPVESDTVAETSGSVPIDSTRVEVGDVDSLLVPARASVIIETAAEAVPEVKTEVVAVRTESCFTLGPFRDLEKLRGLTRDIKNYVATADFRGEEKNEQSMYWVYLPSEASHADAVATGKQLKAKKIKDFYIIRDGEQQHGLSLGYFRNKDSAYGLTQKVRDLGFTVVVEPVFKTYTNYWLDYRLADEVKIPEMVFDKYIQAEESVKVSRTQRDCED